MRERKNERGRETERDGEREREREGGIRAVESLRGGVCRRTVEEGGGEDGEPSGLSHHCRLGPQQRHTFGLH